MLESMLTVSKITTEATVVAKLHTVLAFHARAFEPKDILPARFFIQNSIAG